MSAVQYPFIDIAVHPRVRDHFAAGKAVVLFSQDLGEVLWTNGLGARLFGKAAIYDLIDQGPPRLDLILRQARTTARQLHTIGDNRTFLIRITAGFERVAVQALCELIGLPDGEKAVLLAVPAADRPPLAAEAARQMMDGFDDPGMHVAVLDGEGHVVSSSPEFDRLNLTPHTARMLVTLAANDRDRLVKRPVPTAAGYLPAAIARLSDDPALNLLFLVQADPADRDPALATEDRRPEPIVAALPVQAPDFDEALTAVSGIVEMEDEEEVAETDPAVATEAAGPAASSAPEPEQAVSCEEPVAEAAPRAPALPDEAQQQVTSDGPTASDVAAAPSEQASAPRFEFRGETRATRFVWKIDADGCFCAVSPELAAAVGPHAAEVIGLGFADVAALFNLDPEGKITELLTRRDTWSGKTIYWPVEGTSLRVPIDLAALPTYTRNRDFDGFRGFGIVRIADVQEDPMAIGLTLVPGPADAPAEEGWAPEGPEQAWVEQGWAANERAITFEESADAAQESEATVTTDNDIEPLQPSEAGEAVAARPVTPEETTASVHPFPGAEKPVLRIVQPAPPGSPEKVVRIEDRRPSGRDSLTPVEQAAFREIARRLDAFRRPDAPAVDTPTAAADDPATAVPDHAGEPADTVAENRSIGGPASEPTQALGITEPVGGDDGMPLTADEDDAPAETEQAEGSPEAPSAVVADEAITTETADDAADALPAAGNPAEDAPAEDVEDATVEEPQTAHDTGAGDAGDEDAGITDVIVDDAEASEPEDAEHDRITMAEAYAQAIKPRQRPDLSADIIDQMPVALLVHAGDRLIHANPEFLRLTGYDSLDALEAVGGLDALLQRQDLEDKTSEAGGMVVVRADDSIVPVTARLQTVRWEQSTALILALMPVMDAAEKPTTEDPARQADRVSRMAVEVDELRAILDTATDGVVIIGSEGEIRSMNRAASALFNYDNDETAGKPFVMLFAHESQKSVMDYLAGLAGHGVASLLNDGREVIGREASGGFLPLFMTIGHLTSSNGYCAVIRDITQWKRTEEELRNAKRAAETANAHKSDFLAHVSHEIRTPLNAIIGFADMMATERLGPLGHPRYVEYANDIGRSGRHVLDIVNDLLDISKIEAGEMDLDFSAVGLNETVAEAVSLVQPQANGQRVIIRTALSQSVPPVVADLRSIKQIILNILSNAIRFTPSGGQIVVSTAYEANGSVVLRIRDTGIGMTRSELELAMKPFRQVAGGTRKRGDGTGLGLPLTKAMVDANRAAFAIHSAPNEGTLVEVTFPSPRVLAT
ncbi:ATP-binding protein [Rhizobium sp. CSW-27]|uniref:ATP-binding protein n=1 Tax=Rhizobium sp. CSW-27 TaxID=2839985 RepID=UPI001C02C841|nr:ATP-binding protein [Rhizobium sp. CSW-27]MBT9371880.1 PAS domain S-box protein [Rhizobium sp. CSW-27]